MAYFILGIALLLGVLLAARWFATADPHGMAVVLKRVAIGLLLAAAVFLIVTGRFTSLIYLAPIALPWLLRLRNWSRTAKTFSRMAGGGGGGQTSAIRTRFLSLTLEHDTGVLSGEILEGPYAGRAIEGLSRGELIDLLRACQTEDAQSAQVLEAYLDRIHPDWRGAEGAGGGSAGGGAGPARPGGGRMDRAEALQVLGLEEGADADQIKEAYHRLMAGLHPDRGGSNYLAAKLNEAKDVLLSG